MKEISHYHQGHIESVLELIFGGDPCVFLTPSGNDQKQVDPQVLEVDGCGFFCTVVVDINGILIDHHDQFHHKKQQHEYSEG